MAEVGILIIDDDVASQRALKSVLDAEGWRVRILPAASLGLGELATGIWDLAIVNIALMDVRGPLFAILRELSQAELIAAEGAEETPRKHFRALFLVPVTSANHWQPILERDGLPYSLKPYHLHEFLEKVSELLVESGAIEDPIRSIGDFSPAKRRVRARRKARDRRMVMFASRDDYQMSEEELAEFEKQEEEDRKKREKEQKDREHL